MPSVGNYLKPENGPVIFKSYQHASRLYLDNLYALAPKASWLYYVLFDINPAAITDPSFLNRQSQTQVGMLVKSCDLPKFSPQTEVVNQYNRKTVIQKGITYNPVNIMLHDDQNNTTHNMWLNYYRYYFGDANNGVATQLALGAGRLAGNTVSGLFGGSTLGGIAGGVAGGLAGTGLTNLINGVAGAGKGGFKPGSQYENSNNLFGATDYGLNSPLTKAPFFRSITIHQLNRQLFTSFTLVNPLISAWDHDKLDQTNGKLAESRMSVAYETVFYGKGQVVKDNPSGFAVFQYDNNPSPLGIGPKRQDGKILGAINLFGDVTGLGNTGKSPINTLNAAVLGVGVLTGGANVLGGLNGFSVAGSLGGLVGQGVNAIGSNLNLNLGGNTSVNGAIAGTAVSVLGAAGVGRSNVVSNGQSSGEIPPITTFNDAGEEVPVSFEGTDTLSVEPNEPELLNSEPAEESTSLPDFEF